MLKPLVYLFFLEILLLEK